MSLTAVDLPELSDAGRHVYNATLRKYPAQALVRLDVLAHNMAHMVEMTAEHARVAGVEAPQIMGVVKADAYGHG